MTRSKVKLAFIEHDASRKATYNKRKKGLLKKVNELSILCNVEASAIIYSQYESQPVVWPNIPAAQRVIAKFKRLPEYEQGRKMVNQEEYIRQRIMKATDQLNKLRAKNKEKEMREVMYQCLTGSGVQNLGMEEVSHLGRLLDLKLNDINRRIEFLARGEGLQVDERRGEDRMQVAEQQPNMNFGEGSSSMNMNGPQRSNGWVNNHNEQVSFGSGFGTMLPFGDYSNATWPGAFLP